MATEKRLIDPMLIDFDDVDILECTDVDDIIWAVEKLIDEQPTVDAVEVVHGEWTIMENDYDCTTTLECSVCEMSFCFEEYDGLLPQAQTYHYCPNCGAKMDGEGND